MTIWPLVGSSSRVSRRPVVVFPHPDSPTRPRVCPLDTDRSIPSTARTAPTFCRKMMPRVTGKCLTRAVTRSSSPFDCALPFPDSGTGGD